MTLGLSDAVAVLDAQPFSRLLGTRVTRFDTEGVVLELDIADQHRQQAGLVHGGVYAYLVDNAAAFAAGTAIGPRLVSTNTSLTLVNGVREGTLRAHAVVQHAERGQAVCMVTVSAVAPDGTETVCALGQGTAVATGGR